MSGAEAMLQETIGPNELLFRMHARKEDRDLVSASVFAAKLTALIKALQAADRAVNRGVVAHDYKIARLKSSSPTALLAETRILKFEDRFDIEPAIPAMGACLEAVISGEQGHAREFGECAERVARLAKGAVRTFAYAEVWTGPKSVYRVDDFLRDQATAITKPPQEILAAANDQWFRGVVIGSFDGEVRVVDTRGELPEIKLILSAGRQEIDCVCRADQIAQLGALINKRVMITGRAIYDGTSGLPRRVEIASVEPKSSNVDFSRWKGAFRHFEPSIWPDGEE